MANLCGKYCNYKYSIFFIIIGILLGYTIYNFKKNKEKYSLTIENNPPS